MHWKIARDPYLSALCQKHGEKAAWDAGFFEDDATENASLDDVAWLCTPRPKRTRAAARPAVLLSTGGFFPVHGGHLAMMERARVLAEDAGYDVLGGYLSPGHDSYLQLKCGPDATRASERLRRCAEAVATSDWLSVDPWEALHCRVAVNFTDVVARLEAYLRAHVDPRIDVIYVCGGDNARFAYAFAERGQCVVIGRPGADSEFTRWRAKLGHLAHLIWAEGDHPGASRALRGPAEPPRTRARLAVRVEDERAVRTLQRVDWQAFQQALRVLLAAHADVRAVPLVEPARADDVINLDAMIISTHNLAISRLFAQGGYERLGHVARPGAAEVAAQIANIPAGTYVLRDDDRVSGETLAAVHALLPANIAIRSTELSLSHAHDEDVVDARDFLLGADHGGLVLQLPNGQVARAPYVFPYVDPYVRASIRAPHAFSIAVWSLNARTFAATDLCVRDLPAPARALLNVSVETRLESVCTWHVAQLRRVMGP